MVRKNNGLEDIDPKILDFQKKDVLKKRYNERKIDIAYIDEELWRRIFASLNEGGLIKVRNAIVHNGWEQLSQEYKLLDLNYIRNAILTIIELLYKIEEKVRQLIDNNNWYQFFLQNSIQFLFLLKNVKYLFDDIIYGYS